ncbi:MAG: hypothetical protein NC078_10035 [Ruminococcus sp.]|nr:hypothetical protein [Ruminococcus sp.]
MKMKIVYPFLCIMLCFALFTSCTSPLNLPPKPRINGGYTLFCTVTSQITPVGGIGTPDSPNTENADNAEEFTFSGNVRRLGGGFWEMELTSPESLAGLKITSSGDSLTSSLGELAFSAEMADIPKKSPVLTLFRCLDNASVALSNGVQPQSAPNAQGWSLTAGEYSLLFDSEGTPVAMTAAGFSAEFGEFTVTEGATLGSSRRS